MLLGPPRWLLFSRCRAQVQRLLSAHKWMLSSILCCEETDCALPPGPGHGVLIFTQYMHSLMPLGRLTKFHTTGGAPVHLTTDMLYLGMPVKSEDGLDVGADLCSSRFQGVQGAALPPPPSGHPRFVSVACPARVL
jgi:hypothetical protein